VQDAFKAEVASVLVKVHINLYISPMSVETVLFHFGKEGGHQFEFHKPLPMSFYRRLQLFMPRKLDTPLLLFSDLSASC
jgi:biotin synthase-related radical SAM superfamily protein